MTICYLDASAWVKRYHCETGTESVQRLFQENAGLACSSLGLVEVSATLARKLKAGQISQTAHQQKQRELLIDWSLFIQIQFIDEILTEALRLTSSFALKGADAIHLASASVLKCTVDDSVQMMMMTSDRELASAASMIGIEVTDPTE